jgi:outer membrane immunogenic protein
MKIALACISVALICATPGYADDTEAAAPSVEDLNPVGFDWSGAYLGAFVAGISTNMEYDPLCSAGCSPGIRDMDGVGWSSGVLLGWNHQVDNFVVGVEGDYAFSGEVAKYADIAEATEYAFENIATLRARLGMTHDNTLVFASGGVALVETTFSSADLPVTGGLATSDSKWLTGWVIGGGVEHAFDEHFAARLDYSYMGLPNTSYFLTNGVDTADISHSFDGVHTIRIGLTYNFGL